MKNTIFELEQEIMQCWHVVDDIDIITKYFLDDKKFEGKIDAEIWDEIANKYLGIKELYDVKFDHMFQTFETLCREYHTYRKLSQEDRTDELVEAFNNYSPDIWDNRTLDDVQDIPLGTRSDRNLPFKR